MAKVAVKTVILDMQKARTNPGPHTCPAMLNFKPGAVPFMTVPEHLQGYVMRYEKLYDQGRKKRGDLLQEVFWATMKALPVWQKDAPREASCYELRNEWQVVAVFESDDQD